LIEVVTEKRTFLLYFVLYDILQAGFEKNMQRKKFKFVVSSVLLQC